MKLIRLFANSNTALGETKTPVVFYLKGAPKPMFASKEKWGETCTIVIDDTEGSAGIKPAGITIIFRDDLGNILSQKEYKSGSTIEIPTVPVKLGYDFIGWGDVEIDKAVTNMTFIALYEVTPKVTITMGDSYTDSSSIALNATKTETVTGELSFTTDLDSDIAHIIDNVLIFDKHYEGSVTVTASALDKHSNIQTDSKTITVSCDVADTIECSISNITAEDVEADATSAIIKYDCNVTTTTHAGVSNTVVTHKEKTVTFEANESEEDVTRSGSFTCEHGETIEWSVIQHGIVLTMPKDYQIWYKTNDGIIIVPLYMSPTTNEYTSTKGVMSFADNVTSIASSAFMSKPTLTEFYGGMSLTTVGYNAFALCLSLTTVDLPNCTSVASSAFFNCGSLARVNLPNCTYVGNYAFGICTKLTNLTLGVTTMTGYYYISYYKSALQTVNLPSCTTVGSYAFESCSSLTSIDLPKCTSVAEWAFRDCTSLTSIDLPNCTTVDRGAFAFCSSLSKFTGLLATEDNRCLMSNSTILAFAPAGLTSYTREDCTSVGSYAFEGCPNLTSIDFPNCTSVGNGAFYSCSSLTNIDLPNCTSVGNSAFYLCTSLTNLTLGVTTMSLIYNKSKLQTVNLPNCTSIIGSIFADCPSLSKFTGLMATEDNRCLMSNGTMLAFAPAGLTSYVREDCTSVGSYVFYRCSSLTSIDLPNCTSVGNYAFAYCSSLSKFTGLMATEDNRCLMSNGTILAFAPAGLTSYAREDCTTVGITTFLGCTNLTSIDLPNCTSVSNYAFADCTSLTSINLPSCTTVGSYAFVYCSRLTSIDLPNCTSVGLSAFKYCSRLTNIDLPNCTSVGDSAFQFCSSLTSVNLPNCSYVGSYAFASCSSLTTVALGTSTMCTLGNSNAFNYCSSLTSIYVPVSLVNIYKTGTNWIYFSNKIYPDLTFTYKSLSITADDVSGRGTTTTIHCTWLTDGNNVITGEELSDIEITEDVISEPFDQNTSETETVERTITYSDHGLTASCTITQGVWLNQECNIDLNSQWIDSTKSVSGYKVLMSDSNKGVNRGYASMKVEFTGIPDFKLYINSYAESSYDYTIAWNMDIPAPTSLPSDTTTGAKANTKGKQYNPTSISNFTEVSYPNDGETHYVWITYRKDSSGNSSDDRGYVAIPNEYVS